MFDQCPDYKCPSCGGSMRNCSKLCASITNNFNKAKERFADSMQFGNRKLYRKMTAFNAGW